MGSPLCHNGRPAGFAFPGLIPLMRGGYLGALNIDSSTRLRLLTYLDFVSERASGTLITTANYIRNFIRKHPNYMGDSVVSEPTTYDLMRTLQGISSGDIPAPELLGRFQTEGIFSHNETAHTMMARMQRKFEGPEATLLHGSSMPPWALAETIKSIANVVPDSTRCESCP